MYNYSTVLVQRCIIVQYEGNFEGKEHKTLESTRTKVQLLSYFRTDLRRILSSYCTLVRTRTRVL